MPRGAKVDVPVTNRLRQAGFFKHGESFVGQNGHLYLKGEDKSRIRHAIFRYYGNVCIACGHMLEEAAPKFNPHCGAWHHKQRCDCVECGELRCDETTGRKCHAHRTPGFDRDAEKQKAKKEEEQS